MITKPMDHQLKGCERLAAADEYFALGAEQGTGKTWMLIADAERQWELGRIDAVLVIAPKGVHTNWVVREFPKHCSVPYDATFWLSGAGVKHQRILAAQLKDQPKRKLMVHAMNIDAVNTNDGYTHAKAFLARWPSMVIVDESQRIKNPNALRTKKVMTLRSLAVSRRISSGTLVANSPLDLYSQFEFLAPGLLGTTSYRAFVAEYAVLLPQSSALVQDILRKSRGRGSPQVVAKDSNGVPKFRNIERLRALMAPHTFRVTKAECLDLPEKIYQTIYFELSPSQRKVYDALREDRRWEREDGSIDSFTALTIVHKLRQVTSGFVLVDGEPTTLAHAQTRMEALIELVEDLEGQVIVWASFRQELALIAQELAAYGPVVTYHGGTSAADRENAVDSFQNGSARFFVANPAAAGTGLTLTAAKTVVYYSNSWSLEERLQSEDRAHRIGTKDNVLYIDIAARGTIDDRIAAALQGKEQLSEAIMRDL